MQTRTKLLALAAAVVAGLAVVWAFLPASREATGEATPEAAPTEPTPPEPAAPAPGPDAEARARIGAILAQLERRADERDDDWLTLEQLAGGYLERQRLTGDWEDFARAEAALERAFTRAPAGAGPFLARAQLHYTLHRLDRIEEDLAAVERFAIVRDEQRRAVRVMRANVALQSGRYDEARDAFDALLAEARERDALTGAAGHRVAIGAHDEAHALLAEAEQEASGAGAMVRAWLCLVRGLVDLEAGALDEALAHYRRGLALMPGWYLIEEHIAEVLAEQGHHDEALTIYAAVIERTGDPELVDAAAGVHEARGERAQAEALRQRAHAGHEARIAAFPTAAFGHALDHFLEHEGDAARAVELAEQNRDVRPNGEAWTKLARAYLGVGRVDDARAALAEVERMPFRSSELTETRDALAAAEAAR
ncbi:MAG: tetratricopeptide repeat protein [Sandaracinaceae bacterium]|nr:tetratricopeptide repeat protein [Sandaracinaceae bacterium]